MNESSEDLQESRALQLAEDVGEEPGALGESLNIRDQARRDEEEEGSGGDGDSYHVELKVVDSFSRQKGLFKNMKRKYLKRVGDMFQVKFGNSAHNLQPESAPSQALQLESSSRRRSQHSMNPYQNLEPLNSPPNQQRTGNLMSHPSRQRSAVSSVGSSNVGLAPSSDQTAGEGRNDAVRAARGALRPEHDFVFAHEEAVGALEDGSVLDKSAVRYVDMKDFYEA